MEISRKLLWPALLSVVLTMALHLAAAYLVLPELENRGRTAIATAAISLNLTQTAILESVEESNAEPQVLQQDERVGETAPPTPESRHDRDPEPPNADKTERSETGLAEEQAKTERQARAAEAARREEEAAARRHAVEQERRRQAEAEAARRREVQEREKRRRAKAKEQKRKAQAAIRARAAQAERARKAAAARVSASAGALSRYHAKVQAHVKRIRLTYPRARKRQAFVLLQLSQSGRIAQLSLSRSSGDQGFDRAALKAIRRSAPFPEAPEGTPDEKMRFKFDAAF